MILESITVVFRNGPNYVHGAGSNNNVSIIASIHFSCESYEGLRADSLAKNPINIIGSTLSGIKRRINVTRTPGIPHDGISTGHIADVTIGTTHAGTKTEGNISSGVTFHHKLHFRSPLINIPPQLHQRKVSLQPSQLIESERSSLNITTIGGKIQLQGISISSTRLSHRPDNINLLPSSHRNVILITTIDGFPPSKRSRGAILGTRSGCKIILAS
mmetsp:Transcript_23144/g.26208  ORF Transcript_23144/g.26208 Transcript_23144/m.26208 type:complete len:216 (-) Transcript_23144:380-1027(-)